LHEQRHATTSARHDRSVDLSPSRAKYRFKCSAASGGADDGASQGNADRQHDGECCSHGNAHVVQRGRTTPTMRYRAIRATSSIPRRGSSRSRPFGADGSASEHQLLGVAGIASWPFGTVESYAFRDGWVLFQPRRFGRAKARAESHHLRYVSPQVDVAAKSHAHDVSVDPI
jgi:hypothetical protein